MSMSVTTSKLMFHQHQSHIGTKGLQGQQDFIQTYSQGREGKRYSIGNLKKDGVSCQVAQSATITRGVQRHAPSPSPLPGKNIDPLRCILSLICHVHYYNIMEQKAQKNCWSTCLMLNIVSRGEHWTSVYSSQMQRYDEWYTGDFNKMTASLCAIAGFMCEQQTLL